MKLQVIEHPLVTHKLTVLRDKTTPSPVFRQLVEEIIMLLSYESTRDVEIVDKEIDTPVTSMIGKVLSKPAPLVVPILRAGLGMLEGMTRLMPTAEVGFLGLRRDEDTFEAITYANRLPDDLTDRQCFVLDPMLATGHTLIASIDYLLERGARDVTAICILAAPEGLAALEEHLSDNANVRVVVAAVDEKLDDRGFIVPGLGDAGDRLYGIVD